MHFGPPDVSVGKPEVGCTFELSPSGRAILTPQAHDVPDCPSNGNRLDVANFADDIEMHIVILVRRRADINIADRK